MLLGFYKQLVGARQRFVVDYRDWLATGEVLSSVTCTVDAGTATVDTIVLSDDQKSVSFFLAGGSLGDQFNIIVEADTSLTARRFDRIEILVETNGGPVALSGNQQVLLSIVGPTGYTGAQGNTGPSSAPTGAAGPTGNTGPTGLQGTTGVTGNTGPTGLAGDLGSIGATGPTGAAGAAGGAGAQGATGNTGPTGTAGGAGSQGATGNTGPTGPTGTAGGAGSQGATGVTGPTGSAGANGAAGATGNTGPTGSAGANGAAGVTGNTGPTGSTGSTGSAGSGGTGPTGATGATGPSNIPQNSKSADYTTVLGDAGFHILHPTADSTARTFTIDSNAHVAYSIGTCITFVNEVSAGVLTIAITTDAMYLAGATNITGNRTLTAVGIATALKITSTEWVISGVGLT